MNTLLNKALVPALTLGLLAAASPAVAKEADIVVQSPAAMEQWSNDMTRTLNRRLVAAERITKTVPSRGIVQIRFTLDETGRPHEMTVYNSSGDVATDRVAMKALRGIRGFDEAPVLDAKDQLFQANVIYASDTFEYQDLAAELKAREQMRLVKSASERTVLAFGG